MSSDRRPREMTLATPFLTLRGLRWGEGGGRRLLALHGWLDNAASFMALAPRLPGTDLVALDLTGHGRSDHRPPGIHYHLVDYVPDVLAAADTLGWQRFTLLGHSMGAGLGALIAAIVPERVEALAMIDGIGPLSGNPDDEPARLALATRQMRRHGAEERSSPRYSDLEQAVTARCRAGGIDREAAGHLVERAVVRVADGLTWQSDPRLLFRSPVYLTEEQVRAFLVRIRCPALLLEAEQGVIGPRAESADRITRIDRLEHYRLPGGHHLHLEAPEVVIGPLRRFLDALEGSVDA